LLDSLLQEIVALMFAIVNDNTKKESPFRDKNFFALHIFQKEKDIFEL